MGENERSKCFWGTTPPGSNDGMIKGLGWVGVVLVVVGKGYIYVQLRAGGQDVTVGGGCVCVCY